MDTSQPHIPSSSSRPSQSRRSSKGSHRPPTMTLEIEESTAALQLNSPSTQAVDMQRSPKQDNIAYETTSTSSGKRSSDYLREPPVGVTQQEIASKRPRRDSRPQLASVQPFTAVEPSPASPSFSTTLQFSSEAVPFRTRLGRRRAHSMPDLPTGGRQFKKTQHSSQFLTWQQQSTLTETTFAYGREIATPILTRRRNAIAGPSTTRLTHVYPPAPLPPITQTTLHELELSEILKNVQLRHDIVHDPNLQFRPNYDGERGMQKRLAADKYWRSLGRETERIIIGASNHGKPSKLPGMFTEMRNILAGLLPAEDRASVSQVLDPALLEQQLRHHCLDFIAFADYLGSVMRKHCAPMRDTPIDNMVKHFSEAKTSVQYVQGLQMVFELLEAMKLDVANHQLRLLRGHLLESVVDVERRYWADRVERGRCDVVKVVEWVREGAEKIPKTTKGNLDWITGFVRSFADLLPIGAASAKTASNGRNAWTLEKFPQTLAFDYERVWKLREDLRDVVSVTLCLLLFRQLVGAQNASKITEKVVASLKHELWVILAVGPSEGRWARTATDVALQIAKRAVEFREGKTDAHPSTSEVTVAENWFKKNVLYEANQPSDIYKVVERRILDSTLVTVAAQIKSTYTTGTKAKDAVVAEAKITDAVLSSNVKTELVCFAERITKIAGFHWGVHGAWYVEWAKQC